MQYKHEGYFFCHNCDNVDNEVLKEKINYDSHTFCCETEHTSFIFPTQKMKSPYRPSMSLAHSDERIMRIAKDYKRERKRKKVDEFHNNSRLTPTLPTPTRRLEFGEESEDRTKRTSNIDTTAQLPPHSCFGDLSLPPSETLVQNLREQINFLQNKRDKCLWLVEG